MPARAIDHLVLPVEHLQTARARLRSLGFTVAPDALHPFGTGNACVFFRNRTYLEPLAVVDPDRLADAQAEGLTFLDRGRRFAEERGEGFAMLAFKSTDAEADLRAFDAAGFGLDGIFRFTRNARLPDGSDAEIGVALGFAADPQAPFATAFACQPVGTSVNAGTDYVDHENGAIGVSSVTAVADNPADFHIYIEAVTGQRELHSTSLGIEAGIDGAALHVLTPLAFRLRYGVDAPDPGNGMIFAAFELSTASMAQCERICGEQATRQGDRIIVPPKPGLAAVIVFCEE